MAPRNHKPKKLPDPKSLSELGPLLELRVKERGRTLQHRWDRSDPPPMLYWSPSKRMLFAMPASYVGPVRRLSGLSRQERLDMKEGVAATGAMNPKETLEAGRLYAKFHARPATGLAKGKIPTRDERLAYVGDGVHLVYESDKWKQPDEGTTDYIHHLPLSGSDKVSFNRDWSFGAEPRVIFISGPRLTVNERGIIW